MSKTRLSATQPIRGSLLIEGDVRVTGRSIFSSDPDLLSSPPIGYQRSLDSDTALQNPDFEQGIAPWYTRSANFRGGGTRLLRTAASEDSGNCLQVTGRFSRRAGIRQEISGQLVNGSPLRGSYSARMADREENLIVTVRLTNSEGISTEFSSQQSVSTSWQTNQFQVTPTWSGTLKAAELLIHTSSSRQDFWVDDVSAIPVTPENPQVRSLDLFPVFRLE